MPHIMKKKWPRLYGFEIHGPGPCYVTAVEKGGIADRAGLMAGDQILEINERDVTKVSTDTVKTLARQSRRKPPPISVVSHLHQVRLAASRNHSYGFSVRDERPVVVGKVDPSSPADQAGLKEGDIILGINGRPVQMVEAVGPLMGLKSGQSTLLFIPVGRTFTSGPSHPSPGQRVRRAKELYQKLNSVLGDDYEKKMAVVGVLKQYAENRNIVLLCSALLTILKSPAHRSLLKDFRQFIPVRHRAQFDRIIQECLSREPTIDGSYTSSNVTRETTRHRILQTKTIKLTRSSTGYGFVLRGVNPVFVESVEPGKPAERAGLQAGDFITKVNGVDVRRSSHQSVVKQLKEMTGTVILEVTRCLDKDGMPMARPDSDLSTGESTTSSQTSDSWMSRLNHCVDREGRTFRNRMEYLLTPNEITLLKKAVLEYKRTKDVAVFCRSVQSLLDNPSKTSLWMFLLLLLPSPHQEYCTQHVNLPKHVLYDIMSESKRNNGYGSTSLSGSDTDPRPLNRPDTHSSPRSRTLMGIKSLGHQQQTTFNQQLGHLLTSRERMQLKKALMLYSENRKLHKLLEELEGLFDNPHKQNLWVHIVPLLSQDHQDIVIQKYHLAPHDGLPERETSARPHDTYIGSNRDQLGKQAEQFRIIGEAAASLRKSTEDLSVLSSEDEKTALRRNKGHYSGQFRQNHAKASYDVTLPFGKIYHDGERPEEPPQRSRQQTSSEIFLDQDLVRELRETRKVVIEAKDVIASASIAKKTEGLSGELTLPDGVDNKRYITFVPVGYPELENQPYRAVELDSPGLERLRKLGPAMLEAQSPKKVQRWRSSGMTPDIVVNKQNGFVAKNSSDSSENSGDADIGRTFLSPHQNWSGQKSPSIKSTGSGSVNGQAMKVLQQLDAAMAKETFHHRQEEEGEERLSILTQSSGQPQIFTSSTLPPPPPAAPPLPAGVSSQSTAMSVKRINWEKLNLDNLEDTVWGQIGDTEYLKDVLQYLELEQQFSTKPAKPGPSSSEKKKEVCFILNPKKAYNISILLGHLKLSTEEMKTAMYEVDDRILTPELLHQLVKYAPDKVEMSCYAAHANISNLSQPDQFAYEMSRIPGYEDRLKALVFKANFTEKVGEMTEGLTRMKKASQELRHSKRLAKILELILAMGNHMNKGNVRVGQASAFRISYLTQLDVTKTQDNKHTFLHVLANAVRTKFPEALAVAEELTTVSEAAKVSNVTINEELQELRHVLQEISTNANKSGSQRTAGFTDKFQEVMEHFISEASDRIQALFQLQTSTMEEFNSMVQYFGEDPKKTTTSEIFGIFAEFITKFENAHHQNSMSSHH